MKQLTVRGFDDELERRIRKIARSEGVSMNRAALKLMRKGAGIDEKVEDADVVGDALDRFIGTWSEQEAAELMEAVKELDVVDESLWK